jgi:transposase
MKQVNLTPEQKVDLEALHDRSRDGRVRDRIKAVLLRSEGWSTSMIAQALRLHETSIIRHVDDYLSKEKLKPENGGSVSYLSAEQTSQVVEHLSIHTYRYSYEIVEYIWQTHRIRFSISGLNKWLHQQGFSYKQPKGVPHKFDEEKQAEFIEFYQKLKSQVVDEKILFMDATHPTQATKVSCGWIKKGQDKAIETTGSRTRINLIGAINLADISSTHVTRFDKVNSESIQAFFSSLREKEGNKKKIHLILDGAAYHRTQAVKDKAKKLNIELYYLPPYSPNLNPIERLWKVMNEHARNNRYFESTKAFRAAIDEFFEITLPRIGGELSTWINDNFQVLKPAS